MEKLLHERLRNHDNDAEVFHCETGIIEMMTIEESQALADEIERYYIPRPRFIPERYNHVGFNCEEFTHREPDSLEKIRDDLDGFMRDCEINADVVDEYIDRLTKLIERDA